MKNYMTVCMCVLVIKGAHRLSTFDKVILRCLLDKKREILSSQLAFTSSEVNLGMEMQI